MMRICLLAALLLMPGCRDPGTDTPEVIRPVRAIRVGDLKAVQGREFPGRAKAKEEVDLSFQVAGPLISLPVDVGTAVKKGDLIAALDPRDFQAAVDSAEGNLARAQANLLAMERGARPEEIERLEAAVAQAKASYDQALAEFERNAELLPKGAASKSDYDISLARRDRTQEEVRAAQEELNIGLKGARQEDLDAKRAEIQALEAAVTTARNQLDYATLTAPFDGTVVARYVDNYQTMQAKETIVRLVDGSHIEVTIQVPENLIALVPQVTQVVCRFDALSDQEFTGRVTNIGTEASQTTRTYPVTVEIDQAGDARILPGMAATVRALTANEAAEKPDLVVPPHAIFSAGDGPQSYVWVVEEASQKAARREVKTGQLTAVGVVVKDGLKAGEWVVSAGVHSLREGQAVRILEEGTRS